jgi:hypothetical protein
MWETTCIKNNPFPTPFDGLRFHAKQPNHNDVSKIFGALPLYNHLYVLYIGLGSSYNDDT